MSHPLQEIADRLVTQDNRATATPVFIVQQRRRIYGIDTDFTDDIAWLLEGEEVGEEEFSRLEAAYEAGEPEPEQYLRCGYVDEWEFVTACFTELGAESYLRANRHNLRDPRIYAASGYRNEEWTAIRAYLCSLAVPSPEAVAQTASPKLPLAGINQQSPEGPQSGGLSDPPQTTTCPTTGSSAAVSGED